jgi:hypothetical protein
VVCSACSNTAPTSLTKPLSAGWCPTSRHCWPGSSPTLTSASPNCPY